MPFVSVIMPNFNNAPFLRQWAEPLVRDPTVGEIIVYDNASADNSLEVLDGLGSDKIKVLRGGENIGATLGRHRAVAASRGDLICFVDGDDWVEDGAVEKACEAIDLGDLDFALFQCFDVDKDGNSPVVTTPTPVRPIEGRTACELTMGGWNICGWGVFRRKVYADAGAGFTPHGFLADEVLIRRMFLASRRVGPSSGKMFYRRVPKSYDAAQTVAWGRSNILALQLAAEQGLSRAAIRRQLRLTVRFMFGMARRALAGKYPSALVRQALDEYFSVRPPSWQITDVPWYAMDRLLRLTRPLLDRR